ncbi:MAG: PhnD/SsuA/transferrin family substrate-binding protein [Chloroflexota bacterium]
MSKFGQFSVVCIFGVLLSACGLAEPEIIIPTATATGTPISTELPVVETAVPAGFSDDNPIQIVIVPADSETANANATALEEAISELVTVAIEVVIVETQAEAAEFVCNSGGGTQSVAWVDGMTYAIIQARGCGIGALRSVVDDETGTTGVLLLTRDEPLPEETESDDEEDAEEEEIEDPTLEGSIEGTFCRTSVDSVFGWTLPVIYYAAEGFSVVDLNDVNELEDNTAIIDAMLSGQCDAAGMLETDWETALDNAEDDTLERTVFVVNTTPEIPNGVLAFPFSISLDVITQIEDAFITLDVSAGRSEVVEEETDAEATDEADANEEDVDDQPAISVDADLMDALFGESSLERVSAEDIADLLILIDESGINFAELGN